MEVRFPEAKIKEAILDTNLEIRQRATRYFAKSYSSDLEIMRLVIKAVETFGRQHAFHVIGLSRDLPQTAETIAWIIDELNNEPNRQHENYAYNLSMVLVKADPLLLLTKESEILDAPLFLPGLHPSFSERLQMLSWDEATCWQKLEAFCEEGKDKRYVNDVNLGHARRIVEALARYGDECQEKVHTLLSQRIVDHRNNPMKWMEPMVVRLAGEVQLGSIVPLLVPKLIEDVSDLLNEECAWAFTRIGTPVVVAAIAVAYPDAPHHFRLYATEPLEHIHSDLAVEKCLLLLRQEKDFDIKVNLAHALLSHFAPEGIEESRKLLIGQQLDFDARGLRGYLLETCTLMGERFPEYEEWLATEKAEQAEHWKRVNELKGNPAGLIKFALEKLSAKKAGNMAKPKLSLPPASGLTLPPNAGSRQRVGRNETCPCGSGKKFKNCCLRRN